MRNIEEKISAFRKIGVANIFSANLVNKIVAFLTNIVIVRILSKPEFGILSSANNIYSVFILLNGFGSISGILVYGAEKRKIEDKNRYYKFAIKASFIFDLAITLAMIVYSYIRSNGIEGSASCIRLLAFLPFITYFNQYCQMLMRCQKNNFIYSRLLNLDSVTYSVFSVVGAYLGGVIGAVLLRYIAAIITAIFGIYYCRDIFAGIKKAMPLSNKEKANFVKYSIGLGISSAIATAMYLIDVFLVDYLIQDAQILAEYKTATLIPDSLNFIPLSIIVAILPYFAEHNKEIGWIKQKLKSVFIINLILNFFISVGLIVMAPILIPVLWGEQYVNSISSFRILCLSFFFLGTFRVLSTNILSVLRKVKENLIISVVSLIVNCILDYFLIIKWGAIGAALATLFVSIVSSIISFGLLLNSIRRIRND